MRTECWVPKATNSHTEYIIFISFSPQQRLQRYIIRTLRLLLHINQVNKESISIPLFPLSHHFQCNYIFPKITYPHKHTNTYLSTYTVIVCSQCRRPEHTEHTVHILTFFINIRHWDQQTGTFGAVQTATNCTLKNFDFGRIKHNPRFNISFSGGGT